MKTVNVALLALIISATSSPVVLAGDTIEAAATELSAINSGMSQSEIEQKITRFLERTDNSPAAYTYLTEHHYIPSETPDTTQTPTVQTDPDAGQKTVAATGDVQTTARYQSMINARQSAVTDAQQTQITEQQAQIVATQKTLAATGDTQNTAHYQEMINARLAAQNEANQRTTTEQGQKMNALTTDVAAQQQKERAQYDKQMQSLAQKSVQAHEQIESLRQDSAQTQQQLTNTQKRVADNSQQINTLNNHFDSLKNEVEDNRKEALAAVGICNPVMTLMKTGDLMMVSAGAGTFNGESAVSVGTSFNAGTHTVLKAGISADTQSDFGAGVGVGYSF